MKSQSLLENRWFFWLLITCALLVAAVGGALLAFSTFASYDDEGYVMISLQQYQLRGGLYDQVFSQYGPAYYTLQSALHRLTGLPIAHDVGRWRMLLFWMISCGMAALAIFRTTGNRVLAVAAFLLLFAHLDRLALEPGHPQEWCLLLIATIWLSSTWLDATMSVRLRATAIIGAACGLLLMIKPNLGGLMACAVLAAICRQHSLRRDERWLRRLAILLLLAVPWILCRNNVALPDGWRLPLLVSGSLLLLLGALEIWPDEDRRAESRGTIAWMLIAASVSAVLISALAALAGGTSIRGLLHGVLLQHVQFGSRVFFKVPPFPIWSELLLGSMALLLALAMRRSAVIHAARCMFAMLLLATLWQQMQDGTMPLVHGMNSRSLAGSWLSTAAAAWLLIAGGNASTTRHVLAWTAIALTLGAYPVPGTQTAISSFLLVGTALICSSDLLRELSQRLPHHGWRRARQLATGFVVLCLAVHMIRGACIGKRYATYVALDLPGTRGMRLPSDTVHQMHWLTDQLTAHGATFVFREHARNSYYFWTGRQPPTGSNATCWPYLLSDQQQQQIIAVLRNTPDAVAISEAYDGPLPVTTSPLMQFIDRRFPRLVSGEQFGIGVIAASPHNGDAGE